MFTKLKRLETVRARCFQQFSTEINTQPHPLPDSCTFVYRMKVTSDYLRPVLTQSDSEARRGHFWHRFYGYLPLSQTHARNQTLFFKFSSPLPPPPPFFFFFFPIHQKVGKSQFGGGPMPSFFFFLVFFKILLELYVFLLLLAPGGLSVARDSEVFRERSKWVLKALGRKWNLIRATKPLPTNTWLNSTKVCTKRNDDEMHKLFKNNLLHSSPSSSELESGQTNKACNHLKTSVSSECRVSIRNKQ